MEAEHHGRRDEVYCLRQYSIFSEQSFRNMFHLGEHEVECITFGYYAPEGGTSGEMEMTWTEDEGVRIANLECSNLSWHSLARMKDVIDALAGDDDQRRTVLSPKEFCQLLDAHGFTDRTRRTQEQE